MNRYNTSVLNVGYTDLSLNISEALINEALQNITMSMIYALDTQWPVNTPVTQTTMQNVFHFSSRARVIVPYAACLLAALPALALGLYSLRRNGVPATEGGFLQLLVTMTGSERLREEAAAGCLGGAHNVPVSLKKLKIRYGEVVGGDREGMVRRAAFGLEDEIVPLIRGREYGGRADNG